MLSNTKYVSNSEAQETMRKLFEKAGIPYSTNQRQEGTASIHFINKSKKLEP